MTRYAPFDRAGFPWYVACIGAIVTTLHNERVDSPSPPMTDRMEIDRREISNVRARWSAAVVRGDVQALLALVSDDIVVVHGDGKCVCGKAALQTALAGRFNRIDVERRQGSGEICLHGDWAAEFSDLDDVMMTVRGSVPVAAHVSTLALFARQSDGAWKIARVIALSH